MKIRLFLFITFIYFKKKCLKKYQFIKMVIFVLTINKKILFMKKINLPLLGLVAVSTTAVAKQEVKFGPKAGVNFANISGKDAEDNKMLIGFHVGAFAEIKFNDKFAIQPEILYSAQGAKQESSQTIVGVTTSSETTAKTSYINVPIMAKYYVAPSFAVELGPYVGFLMSADAESKTTVGSATAEDETDMKDFTNSIDFGLGAGVSYNLDNGFFIGARYNLGLTKIGK